jgi:nucleoprotein TPR
VASKSAANDSLAQDLQKQHQKGLELSQQVSTLQQSVQNANSALSSAKFREQNVQQELEQAKRNNEWLDNELKTKSAESLKLRKEKGARIAELQRQNEEVTANLEAAKRTETALRTRLEEVQKKAEESLAKVQQLQEVAANTEEGFRQELESSRRLAELQTQRTETQTNRLNDLEAQLDKAKDDLAAEIARHQQDAEADSQERDRLENRIAELEAEVDRLEAAASATYPASVPGTPRQGLNGLFRSGSPGVFATPGSTRKSTITATQAIEELYKVKGQLATERRRTERLTAEMEEMMQGLEAKQPEIEEMQHEHERLQQEIVEMSKFVDVTGKERDRAKKDARKALSEAKTSQAELEILRQQLRDLSVQVKMLLCDLDAQQRGMDSLTGPERMQLERLARGEVSEDALQGLTDTDKFISQRLTVFRSVSDLQDKNLELLTLTRELGAKMESEEALAEKHKASQDHEMVQQLERKVEQCNDEIRSLVARSESYIKERDMFRRMLQHRGQLPPNSDLESVFGQSVNGEVVTSVETPNAKDSANYATLLRELQSHFDQYREEQSIDRRTMKEQAGKLASEKSALQSEIAKINSQLTLANERYEMLHANYAMLQNENSELQKRSQVLSESAAKQDLRTQQVAEDLIESKGLVESMRNDIANLKAEKKLWTEIQGRLNEDNNNLMNERSQLNTLLAKQQNLQNERELTESESRRRLQTQLETLESELSATKRKLSDEVEDNKKAQLRKEYDTQQSQKRIDELATSLSTIREELVAAKTTRDHLQTRVDELTIELKSAEERVEVLQPRPTPRPGANGATAGDEQTEQDAISREQELGIEVSELKRDLELAKSELENAKTQTEQYKDISQSSEEDLQKFQESQEEYQKEMDRIIEEKDAKIRELQQRVDDLSTELSTTDTELNNLRNEKAETARRTAEDKAVLEAEITRLKDEDERHTLALQFHQQDLRAQAEIATKAQQDYENELVKHADAARLLQELRTSYNVLKSESAGLKAEAESAKVTLSQSQASWEERRSQFEKELQELRRRKDDISSQNTILLQQFESVSAQVTALQQSRAATAENGDTETAEATATSDKTVEGLRELITYLRRDKEIVDVQYELSIQESKRLKQQFDYAQSQLDEARLKLDQERRAQADGSRSNLAHKDLMEKINELNLFRESSITLRNEARQAQAQLADKTKQVEELMEKIQPLENKVRELENAKEMQDGEVKLLQEDRDRWQKRNQEILSKYDRIDPAEMEQLKASLASLQAERDALTTDQQPLQEKVQTLEGEKAQWQVSRQKLIEQAKERSRVLTKEKNERVAERTAERDAAIQEKEALEQQLSTVQQELNTSIQERQALEEELTRIKAESEASKGDATATPTTVAPESANQPQVGTEQSAAVDQQLDTVRKELEVAKKEKQDVEAQLANIRQDLETARTERDQAAARAAEAEAAEAEAAKPAPQADTSMDEGQVDETAPSKPTDDERKALEERTLAAETRLQQLEESVEATLKQRSEKMKTALNKKLAESRDTTKAALEAEYALKLEQERKIWLAEQGATGPKVPATPKTETAPEAAPPATPSTPSAKPPTPMGELTNLTDEHVRTLLTTNATLKNIFTGNIRKKIEEQTKKLKEEFEKEKEEVVKKAEEAKTKAVIMEGKKSELKINLTNNKVKMAAAKLEVVEKAATETPEKPVGEVWEIAKNAKPPANVVPAPAPTLAAGSTIPTPAAKPEGAPAASGIRAPSVSVPGTSQGSRPSTPSTQQPQAAAAATTPQGPAQANTAQTQGSNIPAVCLSSTTSCSDPQLTSVQPSGIPSAPGGPRTGLPVPRGGGAARGRGAYQAPRGQSGIGRGRGGGQIQRGGMNAGAPAFAPNAGIKRPHDDAGGVGQQKRMRGGGGGGQ